MAVLSSQWYVKSLFPSKMSCTHHSSIGQGPYFGQAAWFARFHAEKIPSAIERYVGEIERVIQVLNNVLAKSSWLVGDKCTYADLSFVTWSHVASGLLQQLGKGHVLESNPQYTNWLKAMEARPMVKECVESIRQGRAALGLPP
jgi:glutathione S-transferase